MPTIREAFEIASGHLNAGRLDLAEEVYKQVLAVKPDHAGAWNLLGVVSSQRGNQSQALDCMGRAIGIDPTAGEFHNNLGNIYQSLERRDDAVASYRKAIELNPDDALAHSNLGGVLRLQVGQLDESCAHLERAVQLKPEMAPAYSNLGILYKEQGRLDDAIDALKRAVAIDPGLRTAHSNLLYTMIFHDRFSSAEIYEAHRIWNRQFAAPLASRIRPHDNDPSPLRRLRVGYVSPDFRNHVLMKFAIPLFSRHDHQQFEVFCYSSVTDPDPYTARIQSMVDHWREVSGLADHDLAEQIRQDRIDILVDITMHMKGGRLLVFAEKPAPVQVTWLAYPGTTGLSTIDYRLSDPFLDPPDQEAHGYSEKTVRLPHTFWCYDAPEEEPVHPLPALTSGTVTFGCLNNFCKVNDRVLELWNRALSAVPGARLLIMSAEGTHRRRVLDRLTVAPGRIEFVPFQSRTEYFKTYHRIDLCLDTFPYSGHTTSMDAYWMGVPVVTLVGQTVVGRAGWSQLNNLGLADEFAAHHPNQYVELAKRWTTALDRLAKLRQSLRTRMVASPLMDTERFARDMEATLRDLWQRWCRTKVAND